MARGQPLGGSVAAIHHGVRFCSNTSEILCPLYAIVPLGNSMKSGFKNIDVSPIWPVDTAPIMVTSGSSTVSNTGSTLDA